MWRQSGVAMVEAELDRLYRAAERAGYALGCVDLDDPDQARNEHRLFQDPQVYHSRTAPMWMWVSALSLLFVLM